MYKGKKYISKCVKSIMLENSSTIKNALELEDSNAFSVSHEIHPIALRNILENLHTFKHLQDVDLSNEKIIQHMLMICNWFGMINMYELIIDSYMEELTNCECKSSMFGGDGRDMKDFISDSEPIPTNTFRSTDDIMNDPIHQELTGNRISLRHGGYNPIKGLLIGDKLNDVELIEQSLSSFKMGELSAGMLELIRTNCVRKITTDKLCYELFIQTRHYDHPDRDLKKRKPLSRKSRRVRCKIFECIECGYETKTIAGHPICENCNSINTFDIEKKR
jgi:hypothetical protein